MLYINEWLPNPAGSDAEGEWIELYNGGQDAVSLSGWTIAAKGGKKFFLSNKTIDAGGYLLLPRPETKLTLHNEDGELALFDNKGNLADNASFLGSAPEGKSYSRSGEDVFVFAEPTPGRVNALAENGVVQSLSLPTGTINASLGFGEIFSMAVGTGFILGGLIFIILLRNENLSKLIFGGDREVR